MRDPLIADRVVAWLEDRDARRAAGDADAVADDLAETCTEIHALPGQNPLLVIDRADVDEDHRAVYPQTEDNTLEGDSGVPSWVASWALGGFPRIADPGAG
ncbi:MAG: hypothetical protein U5K30_10950 [Acidimicrobiales bacterium]|nr:hypothetical protein [Acidimicrobiales bacterium]